MSEAVGTFRILDQNLTQLDYAECDLESLHLGMIKFELRIREIKSFSGFQSPPQEKVETYYMKYPWLLNCDQRELWRFLKFIFFWGQENNMTRAFYPMFHQLSNLVVFLRTDENHVHARSPPPVIIKVTINEAFYSHRAMEEIMSSNARFGDYCLVWDPSPRAMAQEEPSTNTKTPASISSIKELEKVRSGRSIKDEDCSICMNKFRIDACHIRMPCSHIFHEHCIVKWLKINHLCPMCRFKMPIL